MKALSVAVLVALLAMSSCSDCRDEIVAEVPSPISSGTRSVLMTRRCGSVEGWAVSLSRDGLPLRQVFAAQMPPPKSVLDARSAVALRWDGPSTLVVTAPTWVRTMMAEKSYGGVSIHYEASQTPYP